MKPIEAVIAGYLATYPDLVVITRGQCCQGEADEKYKAPYQNIWQISDDPEMRRLGMPSPRLQINNFSSKYGVSKQMADLVYDALDGFGGTLDGITIEHGSYQESHTEFEPATNLYNAPVDIKITYRRSTKCMLNQ